MCANSCHNTTRRRASGQRVASAGNKTTGRHHPHIIGITSSTDCNNLTGTRLRSRSQDSFNNRVQSVSGMSCAGRENLRRPNCPAKILASAHIAPAS
jgi:hypothetical protein